MHKSRATLQRHLREWLDKIEDTNYRICVAKKAIRDIRRGKKRAYKNQYYLNKIELEKNARRRDWARVDEIREEIKALPKHQ